MDGEVRCQPRDEAYAAFPAILWADGSSWDEAGLWFTQRASLIRSGELKLASIHSAGWALFAYAKWLESTQLRWHDFAAERADRPTTRYRGFLCAERDAGRISPATATSRMSAVVRFYRWVLSKGLLQPANPPFRSVDKRIPIRDSFGFKQTLTVQSSDLHVPNKQSGRGVRLEDGLHPVSQEKRDAIMLAAIEHCSEEFVLMLQIGFDTGMRLQSILDLTIDTLETSLAGGSAGVRYVRIGPAHGVSTKFGVNGAAFMPTALLDSLRTYFYSPRRLAREAKAAASDRNLIFLNKFGRRYNQRGADKSPSVNVDMSRLRKAARGSAGDVLDFYFHCTRATFATQIVAHGKRLPGVTVGAILDTVRELLLHKNEATSQRYITWYEQQQVKAHYENQYGAWLFDRTQTAV